ncbi:hypothetical protein [Streptomyces sp. NPDC090021]|uniref:hypothetical protein n=1 Tax=Streptomyces sp. NPDC090021 TaxID=3365919 RepID=UPI003805097A
MTRSGDTVRLWVDDLGNAATAPPGTPDIALDAIGLGTGVAGAVVLAAGLALSARRRIVDARSAQAWEREWESVEPRWSGRLRPGHGAGDD